MASQSEISDVELRVEAAPAFAVRGAVYLPDGTPASQATVTLEDGFGTRKTESRSDGSFELPGVARGRWCLAAEVGAARALEYIGVGSQDVPGVRFNLINALQVSVDVRTREDVRAKEQGKPSPPSVGALLLAMAGSPERPLEERTRHTIFLTSDAAGRYKALDAYPGSYRFAGTLRPPAPPFYLAAILAGEQDLLRVDGAITPGTPLTLLFGTDSGIVRGNVEHCASGTVVLIPRDPALRGRGWSRSAPCEASGEYEISGVPPGDYVALALAGNSPVPVFDESLLKLGTRAEVRPGEKQTVPLTVTTAPVY